MNSRRKLQDKRSDESIARDNCARLVIVTRAFVEVEGEAWAKLPEGRLAESTSAKLSAPANPTLFDVPGITQKLSQSDSPRQH